MSKKLHLDALSQVQRFIIHQEVDLLMSSWNDLQHKKIKKKHRLHTESNRKETK